MVTQKVGVKLQFPQLRKIKNGKLAASLSFLAHEVDDALNKVSQVFYYINYLLTNGSLEVKRLIHQNFFHKLKAIPVHYPPKDLPVQGPFETETIKRYRIHYRIGREDGCWFVKSININL